MIRRLVLFGLTGLMLGAGVEGAPAYAASVTDTAAMVGSYIQNDAQSDQTFWDRAGDSLFIRVQTDSSWFTGDTQLPLVDIAPGQPVYLFSYGLSGPPTNPPDWFVNSTDATVTPVPRPGLPSDVQLAPSSAVFVAQRPGIYTVQCQVNQVYSVPQVIIVGYGQLKGELIRSANDEWGVRPFPTHPGKPVGSNRYGSVRYDRFQPIRGWLPIRGDVSSMKPRPKNITVLLYGQVPADQWNFSIPVNADGTFSAEVRAIPESAFFVALSPDSFAYRAQHGGRYPGATAVYMVQGKASPKWTDEPLMASSWLNFNESPAMSAAAALMVENSPTLDTAIAAICNFVSEKVVVANTPHRFPYQDAVTTWQTGSGAAFNVADLATAMLRSVGITTKTVQGQNKDGKGPSTQWLLAFDGITWMPVSPAWNNPNSSGKVSQNGQLTNEYTTFTTSFAAQLRRYDLEFNEWQ